MFLKTELTKKKVTMYEQEFNIVNGSVHSGKTKLLCDMVASSGENLILFISPNLMTSDYYQTKDFMCKCANDSLVVIREIHIAYLNAINEEMKQSNKICEVVIDDVEEVVHHLGLGYNRGKSDYSILQILVPYFKENYPNLKLTSFSYTNGYRIKGALK